MTSTSSQSSHSILRYQYNSLYQSYVPSCLKQEGFLGLGFHVSFVRCLLRFILCFNWVDYS
uniref:Putative ovule protein n=1 Tax=Solanum chacoense TaxID=4108 RepID=A0A0V0H9F8_SOLCH